MIKIQKKKKVVANTYFFTISFLLARKTQRHIIYSLVTKLNICLIFCNFSKLFPSLFFDLTTLLAFHHNWFLL